MTAPAPTAALALVLGLCGPCAGNDRGRNEAADGGHPAAELAPRTASPVEARLQRMLALRRRSLEPRAEPVTEPRGAVLEPGQRARWPLELRRGTCVRILGVGGAGVHDLDLLLFGPGGHELQQDVLLDATPILGLHHPVCARPPGDYTLEIRMVRGSGPVALQMVNTQM